jgi:hypothetical protein
MTTPTFRSCRSCGTTVATESARCVHCGVRHPARRAFSTRAKVITAIVIVALLIVYDNTRPPPQPSRDVQVEASNQRKLNAAADHHHVSIGMDPSQVRRAWGEPTKINRTEHASSVDEQWVYPNGDYVYLTNRFVTAVQTSR